MTRRVYTVFFGVRRGGELWVHRGTGAQCTHGIYLMTGSTAGWFKRGRETYRVKGGGGGESGKGTFAECGEKIEELAVAVVSEDRRYRRGILADCPWGKCPLKKRKGTVAPYSLK